MHLNFHCLTQVIVENQIFSQKIQIWENTRKTSKESSIPIPFIFQTLLKNTILTKKNWNLRQQNFRNQNFLDTLPSSLHIPWKQELRKRKKVKFPTCAWKNKKYPRSPRNVFQKVKHQLQPLHWQKTEKKRKKTKWENKKSPNTLGLMKYLILPKTIIKIQKIWAALRYITLTFSHKIWLCPVLKKQDFKSWRHNASRERELSLNHLQTRR